MPRKSGVQLIVYDIKYLGRHVRMISKKIKVKFSIWLYKIVPVLQFKSNKFSGRNQSCKLNVAM